VLTAPAWLHATTSWPGNVGDPYKFMDWLAWIPHAVAHFQNPFFSSAVDAPRGVNLAWETTVPLGAILVWPVTATLGPIAAYNVWLLVALTLDGWCTYVWLRRHARGAAAFLGGLTFALGPYLVTHSYNHLNLVSAFPIPLLFLVIDRFVAGSLTWWRAGMAAGVLAAAQLYLAEELLALAAIGLVAALLVALPSHPPTLVRVARASALAIVTCAVLAGPMLAFQFFGPLAVHGAIQPSDVYVTDLQNLFVPTRLTLLHPGTVSTELASAWTGNLGEQTGYVSIPLLLLTAYALWRWWREPLVRVVGGASLLLLVLSLGPHVHVGGSTSIPLPGLILMRLPVVDHMLPARLSLIAAMGLALLLALTLDRTVLASPRRAVTGSVLGVLSVIALIPTAPIPTSTTDVPAYFTADDGARALPRGTVALVLPYIDDGGATAVPMLWQAESDFHYSMVDGLAITVAPNGHSAFLVDSPLRSALHDIQVTGKPPPETDDLKRTLDAVLNGDHVSLIIVGPMPNRGAAESFVSWLTGSPPQHSSGVSIWRW